MARLRARAAELRARAASRLSAVPWWWLLGAVLLFGLTWWVAGTDALQRRVTSIFTLGLLLVTAWYATMTRDMAIEMRRSREQESRDRAREKSEGAALNCLEAVRRARRQIPKSVSDTDREVFSRLHADLEDHAPFIRDDEELRDHLQALGQVAWVASFDNEQLRREALDRAVVVLRFREMARATEHAVVSYVRGEPRGEWHWDTTGEHGMRAVFPQAAEAGAWIRRVARAQPRDEG